MIVQLNALECVSHSVLQAVAVVVPDHAKGAARAIAADAVDHVHMIAPDVVVTAQETVRVHARLALLVALMIALLDVRAGAKGAVPVLGVIRDVQAAHHAQALAVHLVTA